MGEPILIAGGGIAGLTAAIALLRRGVDVTVLEQASQLQEIGAGLQIGPNGSRVMIELGLGEAMSAVVSEAAAKEVRHWKTGRAWKLFDLGADCTLRFGAPYWMAHRGDFHRVLLEGARALKPDVVTLAAPVEGFVQDGQGATARIAGGGEIRGRALIGADGIHSRVRAGLGHVDRPAFTGIMAWRGLARAENLPDELRRPVGVNWVGPGGHVITYPLRGGELFNFVGIVEGRDWPVESWTEPGDREECLRDFAGWHPLVARTIEGLDQPMKWALLAREPLEVWADGRVCLMGDACHPTLPFLAQGANMAIEDGMVLARCIADTPDDIPRALLRFQAARAARTAEIVRRSRAMAATFHNPALADDETAVAYIDREWEPERVRRRYDWLYEYDAGAVELAA